MLTVKKIKGKKYSIGEPTKVDIDGYLADVKILRVEERGGFKIAFVQVLQVRLRGSWLSGTTIYVVTKPQGDGTHTAHQSLEDFLRLFNPFVPATGLAAGV